jgi:hypothetical protein
MSGHLKGADDLIRRLKALRLTFKPLGRSWADDTVRMAMPMVPRRTGRLRESHRRKSATQRRATVVAHYTSNFVASDVKPHDIVAKPGKRLVFPGTGGRPVFAKKVHHRGSKGNQYKKRAAIAALHKTPLADILIDQWNKGA